MKKFMVLLVMVMLLALVVVGIAKADNAKRRQELILESVPTIRTERKYQDKAHKDIRNIRGIK